MTTKNIKVLAERHTHAGREYRKGEIIRGVGAKTAEWLISQGVGVAAPVKQPKKGG